MTPPVVVFLHAHPDDEAIFTGGAIATLTRAGVAVDVVFATSGDATGDAQGELRRREARAAADVLGIRNVAFLDHRDSGFGSDPIPEGALWSADLEAVAEQVGDLCDRAGARTIVGYDRSGIYPHRDHLAVHLLAAGAAERLGVAHLEATVDREHLHFVDTHLAQGAALALADSTGERHHLVGSVTAEIELTVQLDDEAIERKARAFAAHPSEIAAGVWTDYSRFRATYGTEWFTGDPSGTPFDQLT